MMGGRHRPLTCCDSDCALANGCRVGGYRCDDCGLWYCKDEIENYNGQTLCADCAEEARKHEQEETEEQE